MAYLREQRTREQTARGAVDQTTPQSGTLPAATPPSSPEGVAYTANGWNANVLNAFSNRRLMVSQFLKGKNRADPSSPWL